MLFFSFTLIFSLLIYALFHLIHYISCFQFYFSTLIHYFVFFCIVVVTTSAAAFVVVATVDVAVVV